MDYRDILKKKMYAAIMRERRDIEYHFGNICKMMPKDMTEEEKMELAQTIWDGSYKKDTDLLSSLLKFTNEFIRNNEQFDLVPIWASAKDREILNDIRKLKIDSLAHPEKYERVILKKR